MQYRLGGDLVDVLPAGAAGTDEAPVQLAVGDADVIVDFEHKNLATENTENTEKIRMGEKP